MTVHRVSVSFLLILIAVIIASVCVPYSHEMRECYSNVFQRQRCLAEKAAEKAVRNGFHEAFTYAAWLYRNDFSMTGSCSTFAQKMGEYVYAVQPDYTRLELSSNSIVCNYGFYVAYVTLTVRHSGASDGKAFCDYVSRALGEAVPSIHNECIRGFGRALSLASTETNASAIARANIATCEGMLRDAGDVQMCLSGTFNGLGERIVQGTATDAAIEAGDPFKFCAQFPGKESYCYGNFKWSFLRSYDERLGKYNLPSLVREVEREYGTEPEYVNATVHSLSFELARKTVNRSNRSYQLSNCSQLTPDQQERCLQGFALGLAKNGIPDEQYDQVYSFCTQALEYEPQLMASKCPLLALRYLKGIYPLAEFPKRCERFEEHFDIRCSEVTQELNA